MLCGLDRTDKSWEIETEKVATCPIQPCSGDKALLSCFVRGVHGVLGVLGCCCNDFVCLVRLLRRRQTEKSSGWLQPLSQSRLQLSHLGILSNPADSRGIQL